MVRLEEEAGGHNYKLSQPLQSVLKLRVLILRGRSATTALAETTLSFVMINKP